jgi:mannose-6-phosphate isomerase
VVTPGDSIVVPAGLPHAIGDGILSLELQEPSDLSLLLEWQSLMSETEAFLGLSPGVAPQAVIRSRLSLPETSTV